jgi:aminopeptidase N
MYLPGEAFLADQMAVADVDAIHAVRDIARVAIGEALHDRLHATYDRYTDTGPYSIDGTAIGRRSLRNACLSYLSAGGDPALAKQQFDSAGNMTDALAALGVLAGIACAERDAALAAFHVKWHDDPLVLDKWFSIQATSPLPDTVARVRALCRHADFDLRNPNRIRALVGAFSGANQVRFHDAEGEGYRFLADIVIQLDPANPQIAARLVGSLGQWRRFDAGRQALMRGELNRILALSGLSKNTYEVVSKSLDH